MRRRSGHLTGGGSRNCTWNAGPIIPAAVFRRHNTRKIRALQGEIYETDVIGDSRRNRTGAASDTKAVTTAIMVVGKVSALPTGIGRFLDVIGCGRRICTATAQPLLQPCVTLCRHTVGAYTPTNKKRTQACRIPAARHRRRSCFPCCFLFIVAWKFFLENC